IRPSAAKLIPSSFALSCQSYIHWPSFHSYDPKSTVGLLSSLSSTSSNIGSNSPSSSCSFPIAGQPKAKASKSAMLSALNSPAKNSSASLPFAFTACTNSSAIFSVLPVPDQYTTATFAIIFSFLYFVNVLYLCDNFLAMIYLQFGEIKEVFCFLLYKGYPLFRPCGEVLFSFENLLDFSFL